VKDEFLGDGGKWLWCGSELIAHGDLQGWARSVMFLAGMKGAKGASLISVTTEYTECGEAGQEGFWGWAEKKKQIPGTAKDAARGMTVEWRVGSWWDRSLEGLLRCGSGCRFENILVADLKIGHYIWLERVRRR
jgi:hypothetical protein